MIDSYHVAADEFPLREPVAGDFVTTNPIGNGTLVAVPERESPEMHRSPAVYSVSFLPSGGERITTITRVYRPGTGALDDLVEVLYRLLVETPEERPEPAAARESAPWELPCLPARREG